MVVYHKSTVQRMSEISKIIFCFWREILLVKPILNFHTFGLVCCSFISWMSECHCLLCVFNIFIFLNSSLFYKSLFLVIFLNQIQTKHIKYKVEVIKYEKFSFPTSHAVAVVAQPPVRSCCSNSRWLNRWIWGGRSPERRDVTDNHTASPHGLWGEIVK